jgi:phage tail-like protein
MAPRAQGYDFLHGFKFRAKAEQVQGVNLLKHSVNGDAGFNSITTPETTAEISEYREGMYAFTRKEPGVPSQGDVTFSRGVVLSDTMFWDWLKRVLFGGSYRAEVTYYHYHRTAMPHAAGVAPDVPSGQYASDALTAKDASNIYVLSEAFPSRVKPAGDLDATASDISLQEMDMSYEWWDYGTSV